MTTGRINQVTPFEDTFFIQKVYHSFSHHPRFKATCPWQDLNDVLVWNWIIRKLSSPTLYLSDPARNRYPKSWTPRQEWYTIGTSGCWIFDPGIWLWWNLPLLTRKTPHPSTSFTQERGLIALMLVSWKDNNVPEDEISYDTDNTSIILRFSWLHVDRCTILSQ